MTGVTIVKSTAKITGEMRITGIRRGAGMTREKCCNDE